jgi:1,4-dihydroxy-2-naphthoate octaprenyltransferase
MTEHLNKKNLLTWAAIIPLAVCLIYSIFYLVKGTILSRPLDDAVWGIAIFLSLPIAVKLLRQMVRMVPADADAQTAKLDTAFGVLLLIVLVIQGLAG